MLQKLAIKQYLKTTLMFLTLKLSVLTDPLDQCLFYLNIKWLEWHMTSSFSVARNEIMITVYWTCTATNQSESGT